MGIKIVRNPKGKFARNFDTDPLARKYIDIIYRRRGRLGKILPSKTTRRIKVPKGTEVTLIDNNTPRTGSVRITFRKIKKRNNKRKK